MNKEEQAEYIRKYFDLVIADIEANRDRLLDEIAIHKLHDYDHVAEYSYANWIRPESDNDRIYYRLFVKARE